MFFVLFVEGLKVSTKTDIKNIIILGNTATTPSGLAVTTANNRRWSVAAQSIASGHGGQSGLTPTTECIPATTMSKLATSTAAIPTVHGERKISFVIQDDSESATSSQTTLAVQVMPTYQPNLFASLTL